MRSDTVTKGKQQAPHRSLFNALGLTKEEMERPLVGIVSSYNEIVPVSYTHLLKEWTRQWRDRSRPGICP